LLKLSRKNRGLRKPSASEVLFSGLQTGSDADDDSRGVFDLPERIRDYSIPPKMGANSWTWQSLLQQEMPAAWDVWRKFSEVD
jgi:hypothetical protein